MKTIEWEKNNFMNYERKVFSRTKMFTTVLDNFTGHFDGKEYWTVREEKCYHSSLDGSVYESVEIETVNADNYLERIEADRKLNDLCVSKGYKEV